MAQSPISANVGRNHMGGMAYVIGDLTKTQQVRIKADTTGVKMPFIILKNFL